MLVSKISLGYNKHIFGGYNYNDTLDDSKSMLNKTQSFVNKPAPSNSGKTFYYKHAS